MQGLPDVLGHLGLPIQLAGYAWAGYGGLKIGLAIRGLLRERQAAPDPSAPIDLRPVTQHLDLTLTESFDQLRRDLTATIERAHDAGRKDAVNAMQRFLLELELFVKGPSQDDRRRLRR